LLDLHSATYAILSAFGVDLAFVFAVLTFFFSYIPAIGGLVALLLPILMALLQFDASGKVGGLIAALLVMNLIIDRFLEPKLMGKSLALSPLVVFVSFIVFTWLWGAIGALIAVPITAIMKVAFEKTKTFRPLALMMGE
jgi:AI-2 transport protein TqsA